MAERNRCDEWRMRCGSNACLVIVIPQITDYATSVVLHYYSATDPTAQVRGFLVSWRIQCDSFYKFNLAIPKQASLSLIFTIQSRFAFLLKYLYWRWPQYIIFHKIYPHFQRKQRKQRKHWRCCFVFQRWLNSFQGLFSIKCVGCGHYLREEADNVLLPPCWRTYEDLSPYHYQCRP